MMRVLIADDEPLSRSLLQLALEHLGHECLVAEDGLQAWRLYQSAAVEVVISDRLMPGIDGLELCRRIRAQPRGGYLYFIFLTVLGEKEHLLAGMEAGADDYLAKPLDAAELEVRLLVAARITALYGRVEAQKTELERLNRELFEQGHRDPLTGLGNRLRLQEDLTVVEGMANRYGHRFAAAMCDVDHFKLYNDRYGHRAGDEVLRRVAQALAATCRTGDNAYRYGGEEFLVILPEQSPETATIAAERLRSAVEGLALPHDAQSPPGIVTVSVGIAVLAGHDEQAIGAWLKEADAALYRAKAAGRNRVAAASPPDPATLSLRRGGVS